MVEPVSATSGTSSTYQTNFAAMQQMLIQQMFHAADANGDGTVSKTEFEKFYNQFMGSNSTSEPSASTTAAADQLYEQLNPAANGLTQSQFASAVKLMTSQKAQGHLHHHRGAGVGATAANSAASSQNATATASNNPTTWLEQVLASANANATAQTATSQSNASMEFIA